MSMQSSDIIIYKNAEGGTNISVKIENEDVWLTQQLMAELFQTTKQNISLHIQNIYQENELTPEATVKKSLTVRKEGKELKVLNNLVAAYFDLAELNVIEEREMRMADFVTELDYILASTGRKVLESAGNVSHAKAKEKATQEYKKYKAKTLSTVEKYYLKTLAEIEKTAKKQSRKNE